MSVGGRGQARQRILRRAGLIAGVLVLLALVFGYLDEVRAFYEAWAIVFLLTIPAAVSLLGGSPARARALDEPALSPSRPLVEPPAERGGSRA